MSDFALRDLIFTLTQFGSETTPAIPLLKQALDHNDSWVRVDAARTLWQLDPGQADTILPTLLEEIQAQPTGFLVLDCLAQMGKLASEALPRLREIIDSEQRVVKYGSTNEWIELDEAFSTATQETLNRIERDLKS
jgi:hypothetical protein